MSWIDKKLNELYDDELAKKIVSKRVIFYGASSRIVPFMNQYVDKKSCIVIDSNQDRVGEEFNGVIISNLSILDKLNPRECIVLSALKNYTFIAEYLSEKNFEEFYVQKYIEVQKYRERFHKQVKLKECNLNALSHKYEYIDFIYDGKFVINLIETIKTISKIEKHLIVIHYMNELNPDDLYKVWDFYDEIKEKYHNIVILNDLYMSEEMDYTFQDIFNHTLLNSKKIVFHSGVMSKKLSQMLGNIITDIREKSYFIIHGGELSWTKNTKEYNSFFSKVGNIVVTKNEHYIALDSLYGFDKDIHVISNSVLSYDNAIKLREKSKKNKTLNILLGYCASQDIDHIFAINMLNKFSSEDIAIYCPLAYMGNEAYIHDVIESGRVAFGDKFKVISEYLDIDRYSELLSDMDIGIFPLKKNCGWTTIYSMLKEGKKIYITPINAYREVFQYDVTVYDFEQLEQSDFDQFKENTIGIKNKQEIKKYQKEAVKYSFTWERLYS